MTAEQRFHQLFAGLASAYGTYEIKAAANGSASGKLTGKALTKLAPVTEELWRKHLYGAGIGIVPVREDATCVFGAIDIDGNDSNYTTFNAEETAIRVAESGFPLVPCRSKSGGLHLYLFAAEPVPAALMQDRLREMAKALGLPSKVEVFPKQKDVDANRGDIGNWINMPYADDRTTAGTKRYAFDDDGQKLSAEEFLRRAENLRQPVEFFSTPIKTTDPGQEHFPDGPPCLQKLVQLGGVPEGARNNGLLNMALYLKHARPNDWREATREYSQTFFDPPMDTDEVKSVIKSASKSSYRYMCDKEPISSVCDGAVCRIRKYGVARVGKKQDDEESSMPTLSNLRKLLSEPPLWYVEVNGKDIKIGTEELMTALKFRKAMVEQLSIMAPMPTRESWDAMVTSMLQSCTDIVVPPESTPTGIFWQHVAKFCRRSTARAPDGVLNGRPWIDEEKQMVYFRIIDLLGFLQRNNFRDFRMPEIISVLNAKRAISEIWNLRGVDTQVWGLPEFERLKEEKVTLPDGSEPIF